MPPKAKFTKEEIIKAALAVVKENGIDALSSRALGKKLGVSSCPIFTAFESMDEVKKEVVSAAKSKYQSFLREDVEKGEYPEYKACGMAYIRFAKEETELFKLLYMCDKNGKGDDNGTEEIAPIVHSIMDSMGLSEEDATLFHVQNWIYVHGIATMVATSYLSFDTEFISASMSDVFNGLRHRFLTKNSGEA